MRCAFESTQPQDRPPSHAEQFCRSDFVSSNLVQKPSALLEGRMVQERVETFVCPCCYSPAKVPEHGKADRCPTCELRWVSLGNGFYVWRSL